MSWQKKLLIMFFASLCIGSGCQGPYRLQRQQSPKTPIFIAMPINNHATESIGPLLYNAMITHFQQRGYRLADAVLQGYTLRTTVDAFKTTQRFISQDIVLLDKLTELTITCGLYNFSNELIKKKTFVFETILPKSQVALQQDAYTNYHVQQMLIKNLDIIEQAFRQYL